MNNSPTTLSGWQIIIMRPQPQSESLATKVSDAQGQVCLLPMVEIIPLTISSRELQFWCEEVAELDKLIVVSGNAVYFAPPPLLDALRAKKDLQVISMGEGTTSALLAKKMPVTHTALAGSTSESLLAESFLQGDEVAGQSIALLAPEQGRTVLAETLQSRRAKIIWFQVYSQARPKVSLLPFYEKWHQAPERKLFVATSLGILQNLLQLTPTAEKGWLMRQPLVVISLRIAQFAKQFGFQQVFVAKSAQDNSLMAALYETAKICNTA